MARFYTNDFFKARVDNLLFYRYRDMMVVRTISGFTKENRRTESKYANCTRSANEFGKVSSVCKQMLMALSSILPKQNNLTVVNSFTKKMRQILECDTINTRGERNLASALSNPEAKEMLLGYEFNPDTIITFGYTLHENLVTINANALKFPKGIKHIGFKIHQLAFDFTTGENELVSGEWVFGNGNLVLDVPSLDDGNGLKFILIEAQYFDCIDGKFQPIIEDSEKRVVVIAIS